MELFVVKNVKSLEVLKGFNNKMEAKSFRKEKNPKDGDGREIMEHIVSRGKDHDRFKNSPIRSRRGRDE